MASEQATVDQIAAAMGGAGEIRTRKMFGEHAVYCDDRLVALVCDNQLYVKITDAGRALLGDAATAPPYPGAKAHFLIAEAARADPAFLSDLAAMTARSLPPPKEKRRKRSRQ